MPELKKIFDFESMIISTVTYSRGVLDNIDFVVISQKKLFDILEKSRNKVLFRKIHNPICILL